MSACKIAVRLPPISLIAAGLAAFNDKFLDSQKSKVIQTTKAEIVFDQPRLLQLDGEVIENYERLTIELLIGAVNLITHKDNLNLK